MSLWKKDPLQPDKEEEKEKEEEEKKKKRKGSGERDEQKEEVKRNMMSQGRCEYKHPGFITLKKD